MTREEIIKEVRKQTNTVLSFPSRGQWGCQNYRGNCSGWIPAYFIDLYNVKSVAEVFAGGGTTSDLCKDMGVDYIGIDLNPTPVRDDIISMDILDETRDLPDAFYDADMTFLHPPYPGINMVKYSGVMWEDTKGLASRDIQNMNFEEGMKAVNKSIMRTYAAMKPGAYEVILVGEIRSKGEYYSMYRNLALPGKLHQTFVKLQHNTVSGRKNYGNKRSDRAFTGQEMIAVIKKPSGYEIAYVVPRTYKKDIRDSKSAIWKDVVAAVLRKHSRAPMPLETIYSEIDGHEKAKANPNWRAKVRQTLQMLQEVGMVHNTARGVWMAA